MIHTNGFDHKGIGQGQTPKFFSVLQNWGPGSKPCAKEISTCLAHVGTAECAARACEWHSGSSRETVGRPGFAIPLLSTNGPWAKALLYQADG